MMSAFIRRRDPEAGTLLFMGGVIVVVTALFCCVVAYPISKRLAGYGLLYYPAASSVSLVFSIMAINNDWLRMDGPYNGIAYLYFILVGGAFVLSLLAALLVRLFWNDKF